MKLICNIHNDISLLPHFLQHYNKFGVDEFILGIWQGEKNLIWNEICDKYGNFRIHLVKSYDVQLDGVEEWHFWERCRETLIPEKEWYLVTDLDEFYNFSDYKNVYSLIEDMEKEGAVYSSNDLVDRTTLDGTIPLSIDPLIPIWEQFPKNTDITGRLLGGCPVKVILAKQHVATHAGHHDVDPIHIQFSKKGIVFHYKWFGELLKKEEIKYEHYKSLGYAYCRENLNLINIIKSNGGKLF